MSNKIRWSAVALILALLAGGTAHALPNGGRTALAPEPAGIFAPLWNWLTGLLAPVGGSRMTAAWGEEGGMMDPDGKPANAGGMMDPDGNSTDAGPGMDPDGTPAEAGPGMDPDGTPGA